MKLQHRTFPFASPRPFPLIFGRGVLCQAVLCGLLSAPGASPVWAGSVAVPPDQTRLQLRAQLRQHLKNPTFSLDHLPEYVVTDAAVVEPAIDDALRYVDTGKPLSDSTLADVRWRAESAYRRGLATPAGLRALEALIVERFAHPRVTQESGGEGGSTLVTLDHGRMPAPLRADGGSPYPRAEGANFDNGVPASSFIARTISQAAARYPDAGRVVVRFTLPTFRRQGEYTVAYQRRSWPASRDGWISIRTVRATGLVGPYETRVYDGDFTPYINGRFSVYENCAELLYLPGSQAQAERLRGLASRCLNDAARSKP